VTPKVAVDAKILR